MAQSVKIDFNIWSQFDHHAYDIITEDFVHDNLFKFNGNILTEKGRVRLQEVITNKQNKLSGTGQANIWFPVFSNKSLYVQARPKGFRLHYDNGLFNRGHSTHNLYTSFESSRKFDDFLFKVGLQTLAQKWRCNIRYRYSADDAAHTVYSRWRYDYNDWTFQGLKALNLNNWVLLKNSLLIGYYFGKRTLHLRLQNADWRTQPINFSKVTLKDVFDYATFNYTKTHNANSRFGIEAAIKTTGQLQPFTFVWETYDPILHWTLKLKASSDSSAAISVRNKLGLYGSYVFGVGLKDIGTQNKVSFGVLVDLNL